MIKFPTEGTLPPREGMHVRCKAGRAVILDVRLDEGPCGIAWLQVPGQDAFKVSLDKLRERK